MSLSAYIQSFAQRTSGGSQPRKEEGASHLARRGMNAEGLFYSNIERYIVVQKCTNIYYILFTQANICAIIYV